VLPRTSTNVDELRRRIEDTERMITEVDILWITAELGGDGGTIAMPAAPRVDRGSAPRPGRGVRGAPGQADRPAGAGLTPP
jgi:hypothetical protein